MKKIRVTFRKLGRERSYGLAWGMSDGKDWKPMHKIEIDPRQKGIELMDTIIHEAIHNENPKMPEKEVERQANIYSELLWKMGFRRVEN